MRNIRLSRQIQKYFKKYDQIDKIYSKALGSYVYFRLEGKTHLIYKSRGKHRPAQEQIYKMKLFPSVTLVLQQATEIESIRHSTCLGKKVAYYSLVQHVAPGASAVKVIVKKTGRGKYHFHSVMKNTRRTKKSRRSETL